MLRPSRKLFLIPSLILWGGVASPLIAQQAIVSIGSGSAIPAGTVNIDISLTTTGGAQPAGLQWTMNYPATDIATVNVVAGASANAASKTVSCNSTSASSTICIVFGVNTTILSDGISATANFGINPGAVDSMAPIQIAGVVVTDVNGNVIPSSGNSGAIAISQPVLPTLSGLSCTPATVTAPGTAGCTVTLNLPAPGGVSVSLSSNNANITVPATVTLNAGQSSAIFTANVASISSNQTALLTASLNGTSQTFTLTGTAPAQISSLSCSPSSLSSNASSTCTVGLNKAAIAASTVTLTSSSAVLTVPASVTVSMGQSSATFSATTGTVAAAQNVTVNGSLNGVTQSASISLTVPVGAGSLSCSPATVNAPGASTCSVTLTGVAPAGGVTVALSSNNANVSVPATIVVPAGASSASFAASVATVTAGQTATLTASAGGAAPTFLLNITAPSWSISGAVSPSSMGTGTTLTLSGSSSATVTADTSGNYAFGGLKSGAYTIIPARSGYTFTPVSQSVTITSGSVTGMGFAVSQNQTTSSIAPDVGVWRDQSNASSGITSPSFSTRSSNELLLAFVATDYRSGSNTIVRSVSGAGLTWVLAVRTNVQRGTAEIWRAFAAAPLSNVSVSASLSERVDASITVMSFTGVDASGTNGSGAIGAISKGNGSSGAPTAALVTTRNNSLVMGVGTDYRRATARTPGSGQSLVHQYLDPGGNAFWVQAQNASTPLSGSSVTINDTAPTTDPYNLSILEILAAPGGTVSSAPLETTAIREVSNNTSTTPNTQSGTVPASGFTLANVATGLQGDACSPGGLASILGTRLGVQGPAQKAGSFPLSTTLAGVQVKVNDRAAPLLFASDLQINFQCPVLAVGTPLKVALEPETGVLGSPILSVMQGASPSLFLADSRNYGVILIGSTNEIAMARTKGIPSRPARTNESLVIYASGLGESIEDIAPGEAAPANRHITLKNKVGVVIGELEMTPELAGLAPGAAGLYQVKVQLSADVPIGDSIPVYLKVTLSDGTVLQSNSVNVAIEAAELQPAR